MFKLMKTTIDTIICVRNMATDPVIMLTGQAGGGIHSFVKIKLRLGDDIKQPRRTLLFENIISETGLNPSPDFICTFNRQLLRRRSPDNDVCIANPLLVVLLIKNYFSWSR